MSRDYQAVRTHYFDEYFKAVMRTGIRQVVILAAGLDSRAYRLDWPAGTTVFEIDQPKVLEYKASTLDAHGAVPNARRIAVAVDLREDWPAALIEAGFDPGQPTAWLAEGLLPYLPADAQDRLFELATAHSAAASLIAVEAFSLDPSRRTPEQRIAWRDRTAWMRGRLGLDVDVDTLMYTDDDRADAGQWLTDHGWRVEAVPSDQEMNRLGRPVPDDMTEMTFSSVLLRARLKDRNDEFSAHPRRHVGHRHQCGIDRRHGRRVPRRGDRQRRPADPRSLRQAAAPRRYRGMGIDARRRIRREGATADAEAAAIFEHMGNYQAVRTHFFDDFFTAAAAAGIRQIVILASGLDSRAYRLAWPAGTTVYEIDQPKVLEYKSAMLPSTRCHRRRSAGRWRWTCATTGRRRCARRVLTRPCRPRGWPRGC